MATSCALIDIDCSRLERPFAANDNALAGTDENGTLLWEERYSRLTYMQARFYDPMIGRLLSIDPVDFMSTGNPAMFNRYAYSFNDPINLFDKDGRAPDSVMDRRNQGAFQVGQNIARSPTKIDDAILGGVVAVMAAPAAITAATACTGACPAIAIGAGAGTAFEGNNQRQAGEFNPVKLGAAAAVGAAGGAGSLVSKTIAGQMTGAAASAGLAGSTVEMLNQASNGTVDGLGVATAGAKAGAGAAFGAGVGGAVGKGLTGTSAFGAPGSLSNGGAAFGAALGEAASGATIEVIDDERSR